MQKMKKQRRHLSLCIVLPAFLCPFLTHCLNLSFFLALSCLTQIADLHSRLTATLPVSYLPLLKPLALGFTLGLMLEQYRALSPRPSHTVLPSIPTLLAIIVPLSLRLPFPGPAPTTDVAGEGEKVHAQTGRPAFPFRFLSRHSNLPPPFTNGIPF